ncbi:hypothetical protein DPMN_120755 [Dreissena polymorpha]|uniref:Uncharacterized protein n=1 Tax=Dreissena polymorpha TaxID=45954 RepID=A0A9D4GL39_DREPO|nr:hypothetical protein DPMN_120755 [Dreissena polymorpha]
MCSTSLEVSSILSQVCAVPAWKSPESCHRYVKYQPGSLQCIVTGMCSTSLDVSSILSQVCVVPAWKSPVYCHRFV